MECCVKFCVELCVEAVGNARDAGVDPLEGVPVLSSAAASAAAFCFACAFFAIAAITAWSTMMAMIQ